jgi:hypothetical protein
MSSFSRIFTTDVLGDGDAVLQLHRAHLLLDPSQMRAAGANKADNNNQESV